MSEAVITIRSLGFAYDEMPVLTNVDLDIWPQDSACIVGPNGGGKTTLVKLMLGLLEPNHGSIRIGDKTPAEARRRIGYVPQYARYDACFPISAQEVVCMARSAALS
ncbi:ATP-binding cassette domain-containing protein, partial [Desulfobulbus sp. F5]|nr:ATP-binding cassette domain-containing protein [Desulfobulbus sp. F5]